MKKKEFLKGFWRGLGTFASFAICYIAVACIIIIASLIAGKDVINVTFPGF